MRYACIIGVNHEWPEQRKEFGDIGLARCLRGHCQLPRERLVELYDERATRSRVLYSLEQLLDRRNNNVTDDDVLLLYYGGHGKREEACTFRESVVDGKVQKEPWLRYDEIVHLLETNFQGGTVWVILDCCHSGGFGEAVMQRYYDCNNSLNVNYGCIMSVPPNGVAGMEWTMSECFIRAFKGELRCSVGGSAPYYLSTKKGKHSITVPDVVIMQQNNEIDDQHKCHSIHRPTWEQVIEFLADEMARIKGDRLTTLFCGKKMPASVERPCMFGEPSGSTVDIDTETNPLSYISRNESWMDPFVIRSLSINDEVYVKLRSLTTGNKCSVIGWLPGRIVSINDSKDRIKIHMYDVITETSWVDDMATNDDMFDKTAICGLPFGFNVDPQRCVTAVAHFAKQFCYLDTSIHPFTRIQVLWTDGEFYPGRVMSDTEINWEQMKQHELDCDYNVIGPYLAVQWDEEDSISLVPMRNCVVVDETRKTLANKDLVVAQNTVEEAISTKMETPYDAMMASFTASGKKLRSTNLLISNDIELPEQNRTEWEAYDAEDKEYLPVQIMNDFISKVPLEVLAYHTLYSQSGDFSVVYWEDDSVLSLLPSTFLRLRSCGDDSSTDSSDSSTIEDECSELQPCRMISATRYTSKWTMILRLGLLSTSFYAGYLFGKRQKAC